MRVYFDLCALQRPLDDLSQLRVRLEAEAMATLIGLCETGRLDLVASVAHTIENGRNPFPARQAHTSDVLEVARHYVSVSDAVAHRAARYQQSGLGRFDALHLAAAVDAGCAFFCTTDDRLLRRGRTMDTEGCSLVSPLDLIQTLP